MCQWFCFMFFLFPWDPSNINRTNQYKLLNWEYVMICHDIIGSAKPIPRIGKLEDRVTMEAKTFAGTLALWRGVLRREWLKRPLGHLLRLCCMKCYWRTLHLYPQCWISVNFIALRYKHSYMCNRVHNPTQSGRANTAAADDLTRHWYTER